MVPVAWAVATDTNLWMNDIAPGATVCVGRRIGAGSWGVYSTNLLIHSMYIFNRALTAAEISNQWYVAP